jgi:DNA (cytosine-5)-methyltransferase 3A
MNVLSLFDGISCAQIALNRIGIKYDKYFASEIEKSSIEVTQHNYPNTIQLGDVSKINVNDLPKIDLLCGGSPCQNLSLAGTMKGMSTKDDVKIINLEQYLDLKSQGFEFEGQSYLFWEYIRLLKELKPKYFLLENVLMLKEWEDLISENVGVKPIMINSSLVSGQDRKRLYWTNIPNVIQPTNKEIQFKDILDDNPKENLYLKETYSERYFPTNKYKLDKFKSCVIGKLSKYQGDRVFDVDGKSSSLSANGGNNGGGGCNIIFDPKTNKLRKLSVNECEKLQTVPVNYTSIAKPSNSYKMLGNGWTVDVIAHIFKNII